MYGYISGHHFRQWKKKSIHHTKIHLQFCQDITILRYTEVIKTNLVNSITTAHISRTSFLLSLYIYICNKSYFPFADDLFLIIYTETKVVSNRNRGIWYMLSDSWIKYISRSQFCCVIEKMHGLLNKWTCFMYIAYIHSRMPDRSRIRRFSLSLLWSMTCQTCTPLQIDSIRNSKFS